MERKAIILIGVSGSGKTTYSQRIGKNYLRVNRDDFRSMLFSLRDEYHEMYYESKDLHKYESEVTACFDACLDKIIKRSKPVIIDNTNLKSKYIRILINTLKKFSYNIEIHVMTTDLLDCVARDRNRPRSVGHDIISKQSDRLDKLLTDKNFLKYLERMEIKLKFV